MAGIAKLPASNLQRMREGGIAGYAAGGGQGDPKQAFAVQYKDLAERVGAELGVDPGLIIAQWALETDWGRKTVGKYNFGNIKDPTGKGPRALDKTEGSRDAYRTYDTPEAFAADYVEQMKKNWPGATGAGSDPGKFGAGLREGRLGAYATDPGYESKIASVFRSLVPSAQAATSQTATPSPGKRFATPAEIAQIRQGVPLLGGDVELPPSARPTATPEKPDVSPLAHIFKGAPETALTLGSGIFAPFLGVAKSGLERLAGRPVDDAQVNRNVESYIYRPQSEAGRQQIEGIAQVAEALKLPPFIPAIGGVSGTARAARAAREAERAAAEAAPASAKVAAVRLPPPSTPVTTPPLQRSPREILEARRQADRTAAQQAALQADEAVAQAAQGRAATAAQQAAMQRSAIERQAANTAYAQGAAQRAGLAGLAGTAAQTAAAAPAAPVPTEARAPRAISETERNKFMEANAAPSAGDAAKAVAVAEKALPPERRKGMDWEDLMMFGFALMAGQSPYALQNVGAAGIAALKGKREREQAEREDTYRAALSKQAESLAAKYGAEVDMLKAGNSKMQKVVEYADKMFDNFLNTTKTTLGDRFSLTSEQANAKRLEYLHEAAKLYGLDPALLPSAVSGAATTNFKFNAQTGKIEPSR